MVCDSAGRGAQAQTSNVYGGGTARGGTGAGGAGASTRPGPLAAAPPARRPLVGRSPPGRGTRGHQPRGHVGWGSRSQPIPMAPPGTVQEPWQSPISPQAPQRVIVARSQSSLGDGGLVPGSGMGRGFRRAAVPSPHLCGVEDADDASDDGAVLVLVLLADQLNVPQFAEVEIPLLLQPVHCQLQVHQLRGDGAFSPRLPVPGGAQHHPLPPTPRRPPALRRAGLLPTCWLSSRICASASLPPLRVAGEFFRRMLLGTLLSRAGFGVFLGPVGEVLWGT